MQNRSIRVNASLILAGLCCVSPDALSGEVENGVAVTTTSPVASLGKTLQPGIVSGTVETSIGRYRKNAVVYLKGMKEKVFPKQAKMDQKNLAFVPHVIVVPTGSSVSFSNSDKVNHDITSADACKKLDIDDFHPSMTRVVTFEKACEVNLLCDLHPEMSAYVVVVESNYFAVTGADGKFTIDSVPPGTYDVSVWSEKLKQAKAVSVTVKSGQTSRIEIGMTK
ncbi:MAG: hypothetical protein HGB00_02780 [Chlorobiaceae bacterium]|nr:hypothetical protein [Chlorobiaceae bacterium]